MIEVKYAYVYGVLVYGVFVQAERFRNPNYTGAADAHGAQGAVAAAGAGGEAPDAPAH